MLIQAKTISDAWFQSIYNIFDNSYKQPIQKGSFENEQFRLQYPSLSIYIERPWDDMVPIIPAGLGIPSPTTMEYIEDYFARYLMNGQLAVNETYTYGSRINHPMPKRGTQLDRVIAILKETPFTNQACIEVGSPDDLDVCVGNDGKIDPPCLRSITLNVIPDESGDTLTISTFFRSWDIWAGLPTNLGGIELLKQYIAGECNLKNGSMYAYSSGAHIYGYQEDIARIRTHRRGGL